MEAAHAKKSGRVEAGLKTVTLWEYSRHIGLQRLQLNANFESILF